jgi:YidC/Oxa1 family membrane protein insertase
VDKQNFRNMVLAGVITLVIFMGWDWGMKYLYPNAGKRPVAAASSAAPAPAASDSAAKPTREGGLTNPADQALEAKDLKAALNPATRVQIAAPGLSGSINLVGALVDDLATNRHSATTDKGSEPQRVFSPAGTPAQYYAEFGWRRADGQLDPALPGPATQWAAPAGAKLTPQTPVTLTWTGPTGAQFTLTYEIDADYLITATQSVTNPGAAPLAVKPYALINRTSKTASLSTSNIHSGPFGSFDAVVDFGIGYTSKGCAIFSSCEDLTAKEKISRDKVTTDWIGFTDIYWMSTLAPAAPGGTGEFYALKNDIFQADIAYPVETIATGQHTQRTTKLFSGAKEAAVLSKYEAAGIPRFGLAIDWGWFRWFEKPIFWLLNSLFSVVHNFGVAIILLTLIVRGLMFPIAQRQFKSMAAMKAIQPKMKAIQERYKDDRQKQQEEIMALYKKEGVNPLAGCLPIFLQIPVFFALYKVLILSVEMRHQPFIGWIKDLSAPDPKHILNLFGMLDFNPPGFLAIGVLALLLGVTMYYQFKLNPAQMDPAQQQIFALMPWIMMFVMAPFAAGLLIYWITSNCLTIAQQAFLYSRHPQLKAAPAVVDAKPSKGRG